MIGLVKTILTKTALSFKVENIDVFFKMKVGKSYIIREPLIFFDNYNPQNEAFRLFGTKRMIF